MLLRTRTYQESDDSGSSLHDEEETLPGVADIEEEVDKEVEGKGEGEGEGEVEEEGVSSRVHGAGLSSGALTWKERYEVVDYVVDVAKNVCNANRGIDASTGKFFEAANFWDLVRGQWEETRKTYLPAAVIKKVIDNVLHLIRQFFKKGANLDGCESWVSAVDDGNLGILFETVRRINQKEHEAFRRKSSKLQPSAVKRTLNDMSFRCETFLKYLHLRYELTRHRHRGLKKAGARAGAANNASSSHQRSVLSKANRGSMGPVRTSLWSAGLRRKRQCRLEQRPFLPTSPREKSELHLHQMPRLLLLLHRLLLRLLPLLLRPLLPCLPKGVL